MRINYLHFDLAELDWHFQNPNYAVVYSTSGAIIYTGETLTAQPVPHGVGTLFLENGKELYSGSFIEGQPNPAECSHILGEEVVQGRSDLVLFCRCCNSVFEYIKKIKPGIN